MAIDFSSVCDDFYVNLRLNTQVAIPHQRESLMHFCEQVQKSFPEMTKFRRSDAMDYTLEEDRDRGAYRWLTVEPSKIAAGHVNPASVEEALRLHRTVLDHAPHALGLSLLEVEYMDVLFGFDLDYAGNHDEVVAESLYSECPLSGLLEEAESRATDVQPTMTVALTPDCRLQARVDVITRTSTYQVRTGNYSSDTISVYLVLRKYWGDRTRDPLDVLLGQLAERAEGMCERFVVPQVVQAIRAAIVSRS